MNSRTLIVALGWLALTTPAHAALESLYNVNVGFGSPQLTSLEASVRPLQKWSFGLSIGGLPGNGPNGLLSPTFKLPSQNITLDNGTHLQLHEPSVNVMLYSVCPFVRFFPNPTGFYLQMTLGALRARNKLSSTIKDVTGTTISGAAYSGEVDVTQILPTLSMGHLFASELFVFSINMGFTFIANLSTSARFVGTLPDSLGGSSAAEDLNQQGTELTTQAANKASDDFRKQVQIIPSIQLLFGFSF